MKYRVFASPSLARSCVLKYLFLITFFTGVGTLANMWQSIPIFCIIALLYPGIVMYLWSYNAFCIITIDENGIHNRHANWKWEELTEYTIEPIYSYKWRIIPDLDRPLDSIICFGLPFEGSFLRVSRKNRAFISITAKNLRRMYVLSKGRSPAVNELWHRYSETLNCEQIDV